MFAAGSEQVRHSSTRSNNNKGLMQIKHGNYGRASGRRTGALDCGGPTTYALVPPQVLALRPRSSWHRPGLCRRRRRSKFGRKMPTDTNARTSRSKSSAPSLSLSLFCLFAPPSFCVRACDDGKEIQFKTAPHTSNDHSRSDPRFRLSFIILLRKCLFYFQSNRAT